MKLPFALDEGHYQNPKYRIVELKPRRHTYNTTPTSKAQGALQKTKHKD